MSFKTAAKLMCVLGLAALAVALEEKTGGMKLEAGLDQAGRVAVHRLAEVKSHREDDDGVGFVQVGGDPKVETTAIAVCDKEKHVTCKTSNPVCTLDTGKGSCVSLTNFQTKLMEAKKLAAAPSMKALAQDSRCPVIECDACSYEDTSADKSHQEALAYLREVCVPPTHKCNAATSRAHHRK
eukprot:GHVU01179369.1.p2 GENE.GHVU01179369.1~~GHVU01179369.1.p2  ORF type:complete len:182 (-),score=39.91 GHVU01179369.1:563-1108(-)